MKTKHYIDMTDPAFFDLETMKKQHQQLTFRIAAAEVMMEEAAQEEKELEEQLAKGELKELEAHISQAEAKTLALIRKNVAKGKRDRFVRTALPRLAHALPTVLLILTLSAGVAVATVRPLRMEATKLLIKMEEKYAELSLVSDPSLSFEVPGDWEGS